MDGEETFLFLSNRRDREPYPEPGLRQGLTPDPTGPRQEFTPEPRGPMQGFTPSAHGLLTRAHPEPEASKARSQTNDLPHGLRQGLIPQPAESKATSYNSYYMALGNHSHPGPQSPRQDIYI